MRTMITILLAMAASIAPAAARGDDATATIAKFKEKNAKIAKEFDEAYGYAVFPSVGKGGLFYFGGAHGKGSVFEQGTKIGTSSLTQATVGLQLGGQLYSEAIFFKDKTALDDFKRGNFVLGAQASAVAVTARASGDLPYNSGVAIITMAKGGLMYEATVGGQKFTYTPLAKK